MMWMDIFGVTMKNKVKTMSVVAHLHPQNEKDILQSFCPFPADRRLSSLLRYENLTMVVTQDASLCLHNTPCHQGI